MKILLNGFIVFSDLSTHLEKLRKCFLKWREYGISLNLDKCASMLCSKTILGFIVFKEGNTCHNPSFGLATKAKGLQGCGPKGSPGVTSGTPGSVGKCEGVNPHTPKATPALGDGVPVDSRNFRDRFEGSNLNGLWRSLYQWKALEA
jgi:hypothetical protein